jgi:dual specificity MAP kinase phosphatase
VLTACKGVFLGHSKASVPSYKYIPAVDADSFNLALYFEEAADFIEAARAQGHVLVHCMAGVSRSATLVLAYLVRKQGLSLPEAYSRVKARRPIVPP